MQSQAVVKERHNWVGRVIATIATCGIYGFWWLYNVMQDGNEHYHRDWWWEDQLPGAVAHLDRVAPAPRSGGIDPCHGCDS